MFSPLLYCIVSKPSLVGGALQCVQLIAMSNKCQNWASALVSQWVLAKAISYLADSASMFVSSCWPTRDHIQVYLDVPNARMVGFFPVPSKDSMRMYNLKLMCFDIFVVCWKWAAAKKYYNIWPLYIKYCWASRGRPSNIQKNTVIVQKNVW